MDSKVPTYKKIAIRFKHFTQDINTVWEAYSVIEYYSKSLHTKVKKDIVELPSYTTLTHNSERKISLSKDRVYGTLSHISSLQNPRNSLIAAMLIFEEYISNLVEMVYIDYPMKCLTQADDKGEKAEITEKLSSIIMDSKDKDEIIERIIEEKIRGIFYGNMSDLFVKDRAKLELKDTFKGDNAILIEKLKEINARRNIYVHNGGKIDRKYVRETKKTDVKLNSVLKIDSEYLKEAINIMAQIAKLTTVAIITNIYKVETQNTLLNRTYWSQSV